MAVQDFNDFIGKLSERIIEIDETIPELPVKDIVSVIYLAIQNIVTHKIRCIEYIEVLVQRTRQLCWN